MMFNKAYVEITNVCNLACPFCPGTTRRPRFLSPEEFARVLSQLKGRARQLYFHVMGEPLLHPQLGELLRMAGEAGFPVNLTTNGRMLSRRLPELIESPALRQVNLSLHSDQSADDRWLDEVLDAVATLRAARPVLVSLRMWNLRDDPAANAARIQRIAECFCAPLPLPRDRTGYKLGEGLWVNEGEVFDWPSLGDAECDITAEAPIKRGEAPFCRGLRDQVAILCDGTVTACCLDAEGALALGNVFTEELDEILQRPRARAIFDGFSQRRAVEPLCQTCGYRERFSK